MPQLLDRMMIGPIDANNTSYLGKKVSDTMVTGNASDGATALPPRHLVRSEIEINTRLDKVSAAPTGGYDQSQHAQNFYANVKRHLFERPDTLLDTELLELILYFTLGPQGAQRLASVLLEKYHTLGAVINSPPHDLSTVPGLGEDGIVALKLTKAAALSVLRREISTAPILSCWDQLIDYLSISLMHEPIEKFHVLFLDGQGVLLASELQGLGTVDEVTIYPREIVRRCLEVNALSIILVHNHPSGNLTPSQRDVTMTKEVERAAAMMGILLHDHVIISRRGILSLRQERLL